MDLPPIGSLRQELRGWGDRLDRLTGAPRGSWLAGTLGTRQIFDLDAADVNAFCRAGYAQWCREMATSRQREGAGFDELLPEPGGSSESGDGA